MKTVAIIIFFFTVSLSYAQISQLLDYDSWKIEQIVTDDQTITEDVDDPGYLFIEIYTNSNSETFVYFYAGGCEYEPFFDGEDQSFTTAHYGCILSVDDFPFIEIELSANFFLETYNQDPENCDCPYSYEFREENDKIYLDITNIEGSVATLSNSTLSNTNFENIEFSIHPNPTSNLLHIETSQTDITAIGIFDLQGKRVMKLNASNLRDIDVSHLTNGM